MEGIDSNTHNQSCLFIVMEHKKIITYFLQVKGRNKFLPDRKFFIFGLCFLRM